MPLSKRRSITYLLTIAILLGIWMNKKFFGVDSSVQATYDAACRVLAFLDGDD